MFDINEVKVNIAEAAEGFRANSDLQNQFPKEFFIVSLLNGALEFDTATERLVGTWQLIEESNLTTAGVLRLMDYELDNIALAITELEKLQAPHGFKKLHRDFCGSTTRTINAFKSLQLSAGSLIMGSDTEKAAEKMEEIFQEIRSSLSEFVPLLSAIIRKTYSVQLK
ncbi:hypothetical protein [Paenibacillus sp. 7541]|uniref:hypothetical protein n=1 Tax=Paenibacillus sp. 7541 TaxID=2026236 RepID=UPI000BA633EE|nr:hypothetical protein [Paenibacillus sp. 7541]PAK55409.1 hypothetical protein CHH75_03975 [Paenibacillus sp. 7541]